MERQLKERLIGAAVLIAVAVIMVPEMFSGSGSRDADAQKPAANNSGASESGQVKTYRIDLQHRDAVAATSENAIPTPPMAPDTRMESSSSTASVTSTIAASVAAPLPVVVQSSSSHSSLASSTTPSSIATVTRSSSSSTPSIVVASGTTSGWSVQLGSFAAEVTAKQIVSATKSQGFAGYLSTVKVGGKTLYRVRVGPYDDRDSAQVALTKLKRNYAQASLVSPNH